MDKDAIAQGIQRMLEQHGDQIYDSTTDFIKDQFTTKEEKEKKAQKKREEIEERERKEREAAGPSLADMFSGFKFGSGRSPFYHLRGGEMPPQAWGMDEEEEVDPPPPEQPNLYPQSEEEYRRLTEPQSYDPNNPLMFMGSGRHLRGGMDDDQRERFYRAHPEMRGVDAKLDAQIRQMQEQDAALRERERQRQAAIAAAEAARLAAIRAAEKRPMEKGERQWGGMINPFDKDGNLLPQFQREPMEDDAFFQKPFHPEFDFIENERRTTNPFYHLQGGAGWDDLVSTFKSSPVGQLVDGVSRNKPLTNILGKAGNFLVDHAADALFDMVTGGIAHNPKGHTTRNNNLTKQKPQKKKFCGFKAKVFEHEDYDPAKMHKFRAATCGGPLSHGGRPSGATNKEGYVRSGEFTERRKRYGESKKFRERIMGEGKQMQIMPDEDDLVSKKENPVVDKIIHEPMDDGDIHTYFPKARVLRYAELADYDDIEELLPKDKSYVFLLYQHRPNDGHFVCLMRYGTTIEFFCSYGSKIDGPLYWTALKDRQALGEGKPYLSMLLRKAGKRFKAIHNPVAFQSKKGGVATCGAYCVMRINQLVNHNQDLHEFIDYMEEIKKETGLSYDEIVANYVNKR